MSEIKDEQGIYDSPAKTMEKKPATFPQASEMVIIEDD